MTYLMINSNESKGQPGERRNTSNGRFQKHKGSGVLKVVLISGVGCSWE